ncbi:hypothetical protein C0993_011619 [Termitomyces sp. T159_Od127]|nr:hypothetical protein C0993_011619 [Termitomyces sp. T159_Od127]
MVMNPIPTPIPTPTQMLFRFRHTVSRRDALLLVLGGALWHLWHLLDGAPARSPFDAGGRFDAVNVDGDDVQAQLHAHDCGGTIQPLLDDAGAAQDTTPTTAATPTTTPPPPPAAAGDLPQTSIIAHAPGWTLFRDLYMSNGTLYIVGEAGEFPAVRMMTSTGLVAYNTPESIAAREPTAHDMDFVAPAHARARWSGGVRVVEGNTVSAARAMRAEHRTLTMRRGRAQFLFNDPDQFLGHYYHFVGELLFGAWAFWSGAHAAPPAGPPEVARVVFPHADARGWRDGPGFNAYFVRAAFPSLGVEVREDWADRVAGTTGGEGGRAWRFPVVLLADRSAAFRGAVCGRTQRTAAEAVEYLRGRWGAGAGAGGGADAWWAPLRGALWEHAGARAGEGVVITYVSRQGGSRRKLREADHAGLVGAMEGLVRRRGAGWEFVVMEAETMTKDAQVRAAARTTVRGRGGAGRVLMVCRSCWACTGTG